MAEVKSEHIKINSEFIKLDQLLKMLSLAGSGGEAKLIIEAGKVGVNEEIEKRRGRKIRPGDRVMIMDKLYFIQ